MEEVMSDDSHLSLQLVRCGEFWECMYMENMNAI